MLEEDSLLLECVASLLEAREDELLAVEELLVLLLLDESEKLEEEDVREDELGRELLDESATLKDPPTLSETDDTDSLIVSLEATLSLLPAKNEHDDITSEIKTAGIKRRLFFELIILALYLIVYTSLC